MLPFLARRSFGLLEYDPDKERARTVKQNV
jgi:hypothetical protein